MTGVMGIAEVDAFGAYEWIDGFCLGPEEREDITVLATSVPQDHVPGGAFLVPVQNSFSLVTVAQMPEAPPISLIREDPSGNTARIVVGVYTGERNAYTEGIILGRYLLVASAFTGDPLRQTRADTMGISVRLRWCN
ncbi:MAG: hypothetical protein RRA92_11505 [Gemmatimonadota bacterium]|nr:hypothetical protein [Gemmatimonadota bacterium]